jgi:hypothetical protein
VLGVDKKKNPDLFSTFSLDHFNRYIEATFWFFISSNLFANFVPNSLQSGVNFFFFKTLRLSQSSISIISRNIQLCPKTKKGK